MRIAPSFLVLIITGLISVPTHAAKSYLCVVDQSTGFKFDARQKEWREVSFKADAKYLVIYEQIHKQWAWSVYSFAQRDVPIAVCHFHQGSPKFPIPTKDDHLKCDGFQEIFFLNLNLLKFLHTQYAGYWIDNVSTSTPLIQIGKCVKL